MDEPYRFVYETAQNDLMRQQTTLDEMRARVSTTLASTVVGTAFFGSVAIKGAGHLGGWQWAGLILFVVTALLQVVLLLPLKGWRFRFGTDTLLSGYIEAEPPIVGEQMFKHLAVLPREVGDA